MDFVFPTARCKEPAMKHHKYHQHYQVKAAKLHARSEAALDFLTALAIGVGLAVLLVAWWSS
jgi:hypothetical protein